MKVWIEVALRLDLLHTDLVPKIDDHHRSKCYQLLPGAHFWVILTSKKDQRSAKRTETKDTIVQRLGVLLG